MTAHTYRTLYLPKSLRQSVQAQRDARTQSNKEYTSQAVTKHLPKIQNQLIKLGFYNDDDAQKVMVRLPFDDHAGTLAHLQDASQTTGIPLKHLLRACLIQAVDEKPRTRHIS